MAIEQNGAVCSQIGNRQLPLLVALMASCIHWAPAPIVCTYSCGYGGWTGPFGPFGPHEIYGPGLFFDDSASFLQRNTLPVSHVSHSLSSLRPTNTTATCKQAFLHPRVCARIYTSPCIRRIGAFNPHASGPHRLPSRPESGRPRPLYAKLLKDVPTAAAGMWRRTES